MSDKDPAGLLNFLKDQIDDTYFMYKICEGCDKLLLSERHVCPNCKSYRFQTSKTKVSKAMKKFIKQEADLLYELF